MTTLPTRPGRTRARLAAPGLLLALALSACGSGDDSSSGSADEGGSSESPSASESPSESGSESPSEDAAGSGASPEAYAALFNALFEQQGKVKQVKSAADFNRQASFPAGVSVAQFDSAKRTLCIQDANQKISGSFDASSTGAIVLQDGLCQAGKELSRLEPNPQDDQNLKISGDQELGKAVEAVFKQQLGGS